MPSRLANTAIQKKRAAARPAAAAYADRVLRPALKWRSGPVEVSPVKDGQNSLVYFLHAPDQPPAVLYLSSRRRLWEDTRDALALGGQHDLPIPRLLHAGRGLADRLMLGHYFLVTDFAPGTNLRKMSWDTHAIDALARAVAALHHVESDRWGKPRRLRSRSIREDWRLSVDSRLDSIRKHPKAVPPELAERISRWLHDQLDRLPEPTRYQLCHHHLFGDDIIFDPDTGRMTLLDCSDLQFSRASRDLACVHEGMFAHRPEQRTEFLKAYFAHFSPAIRDEWEREIPFFEGFYLLIKIRNALKQRIRREYFLTRMKALCGIV